MKTILYTISTLRRSGPSIVLANIVKNLDRSKYKPIILTLSKEPADSIKSDLEKENIEIKSLILSRIEGLFFAPSKLRKIVKEIKPDIIHTNGFRDIVLVGFFLKNYKKVATLHCDFYADYRFTYGKIKGFVMSFLQKLALKNYDKIIAVSQMLADILNKKENKDFCIGIDNGIDTNKFYPIKDKKILRKKLNLPLDKKIFIWCGSFTDRKNPLLLVEAIKQIYNDEFFFVFCGERGNLLEVAKKELLYYKNVLFTGYVFNIEEYLQASDYYISTSLSEGLPLNVIESMACGLPCILSNIPQHKYILGKNQEINFLFAHNTNDLIKQIDLITKKDYNKLSKESENCCLLNFSAKGMSKKYQNIDKDFK